jgi:hypothetical protein
MESCGETTSTAMVCPRRGARAPVCGDGDGYPRELVPCDVLLVGERDDDGDGL